MASAAVYIRVSTEEQAEFSPEAQLRAIKQFAGKNNLHIENENIFKDEGVSGRRADKRPSFQRMIGRAKLKPRPFDVILVHKFDRFARSREDSIVYKSLLRKECGIKVISITEQMEDDKFSVIMEAMLEAMAEYYSLNLGEEVKKGMTEKARRGELQTPAPFGYRMKDGLLTPHDEEAEVIRSIFYKYTKENAGMRAIAKYVNSLGFKTKMGNAFDTRLVEYIIYNPIYIGKIRWTPSGSVINKRDYDNPGTMIVNGRHRGIVDTEIWEEANKLARANKKNIVLKYDGGSQITTHWLRGVLRCASCGAVLTFGKGSNGKQGAYRCSKYLTGRCKEPQRITIGKIEKMVLDILKEDARYFMQSEFVKTVETWDICRSETENYIKRIKKLQEQLEKAKEFALNGIDTPEEYRANKEKISLQINEVNKKIDELREKRKTEDTGYAYGKIKSITDILLSGADYSEKNAAVKEIISKIVYDKKNNSLAFYYYYYA